MNLVKIRAEGKPAITEDERRSLNRGVAKSCREDYREHVERTVADLEEADSVGNYFKVASLTKTLTRSKGSSFAQQSRKGSSFAQQSLKSDGTPIKSAESALKEWTSFLEETFTAHKGSDCFHSGKNEANLPSLTAEEVRESVAARKRKKAPGLDDMPIEIFQASDAALNSLTDLLINLWDSESLPHGHGSRRNSDDAQKGTKDDKGNYRALCLLPHASNSIIVLTA